MGFSYIFNRRIIILFGHYSSSKMAILWDGLVEADFASFRRFVDD